jgi:hypothetical protein
MKHLCVEQNAKMATYVYMLFVLLEHNNNSIIYNRGLKYFGTTESLLFIVT